MTIASFFQSLFGTRDDERNNQRAPSDQYVVSRPRPVDTVGRGDIPVRYTTPRELATVGPIDLSAGPAPNRTTQIPTWAQGTIWEGLLSGQVNTIGGNFADIFAPFHNLTAPNPSNGGNVNTGGGNVDTGGGIVYTGGGYPSGPGVNLPGKPKSGPSIYVPVAPGFVPQPPTVISTPAPPAPYVPPYGGNDYGVGDYNGPGGPTHSVF